MKNFKQLYRKIIKYILNKKYNLEWILSKNKVYLKCINKEERTEKLIVSLTTFPDRITIVHKTIRSILNQKNIKPDVVELWLAKEQFENEMNLPKELKHLQKYGLKICWCNDIKSYKKLVPSLKVHPHDVIITADDDVYYGKKWLEKLYDAYKKNNKCIQCHRITKFIIEDEKFKTLPGGKDYYKEPSYLNKLVGIGGVLYPPNSLDKEVLDEKKFLRLAPTNDDIWFWFMAVKNDIKINMIDGGNPRPVDILEAENTKKLTTINDKGKRLFWVQFNNLTEEYPEIKSKLIEEFEKNEQEREKKYV